MKRAACTAYIVLIGLLFFIGSLLVAIEQSRPGFAALLELFK